MKRPSDWLREIAPLTDRERAIVIAAATVVLIADILTFPQVARNSVGAKAIAAGLPTPAASLASIAPVTPAPTLNYESSSLAVVDPFRDRLTVGPSVAGPSAARQGSPVPSASSGCGSVPGILPGDALCGSDIVKAPPGAGMRSQQQNSIVELGHGSTNALLRIGSDQTVIVHVGSALGTHRVKSISLDTGVTLDNGARIPAAAGDDTATVDTPPAPAPSPSPSSSPSPAPQEQQQPLAQPVTPPLTTRLTTPYQQMLRRSGTVLPNATTTQGSQ